MRIGVLNRSCVVIGGAEAYLARLLPALGERGHEVAFLSELPAAENRQGIALPPDAPAWSASELGETGALSALEAWKPDVVMVHGLNSPALEEAALDLAPAVFFAHGYYGACISGGKTLRRPRATPCPRRFGPACLLYYLPRGCGGLNPATMVRLYRLQAARLELLPRYRAIIVASGHMAAEYEKYGLGSKLVTLSLPVPRPLEVPAQRPADDPLRIVFLGRFEVQKGGSLLLRALPLVARAAPRPVEAVFAGAGPQEMRWRRLADRIALDGPRLAIRFLPWLQGEARDDLLRRADLLVLPSVWPEPFGLTGLEANAHGVPVVAFSAGGISSWLTPGMNGALAEGGSIPSLAAAIIECLHDPRRLARLRAGARERAGFFSMDTHLAGLLTLLRSSAAA